MQSLDETPGNDYNMGHLNKFYMDKWGKYKDNRRKYKKQEKVEKNNNKLLMTSNLL